MKLLREHINEKFTQDSDPIADMNIGMIHQIKLWMKSIDEPFENKDNALEISAEYGKLDFVEYLLAAGADIHAINDLALRYASDNGHTEVVKVLLAAGADIHAINDLALRLASIHGRTEVVKVLKDHIAKEKKVKESLNEKFTEDSDPIYDMNIGIRKKIFDWLEENNIETYKINKNLTINVNEFAYYKNDKKLYEFPDYIKFNICRGNFNITSVGLKTLKGCPKIVESNFYTGFNDIETLEGGPKEVDLGYYCHNNKLISLKGCPEIVGEDFECSGNDIQFDPKYLPKTVGGNFKHNMIIKGFPVPEELIRKYVQVGLYVIYRDD